MSKKLKIEEKYNLEILHEQTARQKAEIANIKLQAELSEKQLHLLEYMSKDLKRTILELKNKEEDFKEKLKQISEDKKKSVNEIKKRLKLKTDFGYNPETLEVILQEE